MGRVIFLIARSVSSMQHIVIFLHSLHVQLGVQTSDEASFDPYPASNKSRLHSKLQEAARRISQLSQEKEQLIQMGNRLRAELTKFAGKVFFFVEMFREIYCSAVD